MAEINPALGGIFNPALYNNAASSAKKDEKNGKPGSAKKSGFAALLAKRSTEPDKASSADGQVEAAFAAGQISLEEAEVQLLEELDNSAEALNGKPVMENLLAYKGAVKHFLSFVEKRAFDAWKDVQKRPFSRFNPNKRMRIHTQIAVVDRKMEQFAADVLSGHVKNLRLLDRMGEIRGLLVDLLR
jgi:uncharacterized protein YaaR (DUF327 family)